MLVALCGAIVPRAEVDGDVFKADCENCREVWREYRHSLAAERAKRTER